MNNSDSKKIKVSDGTGVRGGSTPAHRNAFLFTAVPALCFCAGAAEPLLKKCLAVLIPVLIPVSMGMFVLTVIWFCRTAAS